MQDNILENFEEEIGSILLIQGTGELDKPIWAYLFLPQKNMINFYHDKSPNKDISQYGKILASGNGFEPSKKEKLELAEKYDIQSDFEEIISEGIKLYLNVQKF